MQPLVSIETHVALLSVTVAPSAYLASLAVVLSFVFLYLVRSEALANLKAAIGYIAKRGFFLPALLATGKKQQQDPQAAALPAAPAAAQVVAAGNDEYDDGHYDNNQVQVRRWWRSWLLATNNHNAAPRRLRIEPARHSSRRLAAGLRGARTGHLVDAAARLRLSVGPLGLSLVRRERIRDRNEKQQRPRRSSWWSRTVGRVWRRIQSPGMAPARERR